MRSLTEALAGSAAILVIWIAVALAFIGVGLLLQRGFGLKAISSRQLLLAFWMGLAAVVLFLQVMHFVLPVRGATLAVVSAGGLLGWLQNRTTLRQWLAAAPTRAWRPKLVALGLFALWTANRELAECTLYDSGLYHLQGVRWINAFAIVPGLANLHGRLALNSSSLLYAALLNVGPLKDRATHFANGLLLVAFSAQVLLAVARLYRAPTESGAGDLFEGLLFVPVTAVLLSSALPSLSTDLSGAILVWVSGGLVFRLVVEPAVDERTRAYNLFCSITLLVLAAVFKLSTAFFAGSAAVLAVILWLRSRPGLALVRRTLTWSTIAASGLGLTWLARGVVLSGHPVYPVATAALPVHWRVPREQIEADAAWVRHSARYGATRELGLGWEWVPGWWRRLLTNRADEWVRMIMPVALIVLAGLFGALAWVLPTSFPETAKRGWTLLFPIGAGLVFWFLGAPNVRFGFGPIWLLAAVVVAQALVSLGWAASARVRVVALLTLLGSAAVPVSLEFYEGPPGSGAGSRFLRLFVPPGPDLWFHPLRRAEVRIYRTQSGLDLYVPLADEACWNSPLPCTPYPAPNLRLRRPPNLSSGFTTDGRWEQLDWPNRVSQFLPFWRCLRAADASGYPKTACLPSRK